MIGHVQLPGEDGQVDALHVEAAAEVTRAGRAGGNGGSRDSLGVDESAQQLGR